MPYRFTDLAEFARIVSISRNKETELFSSSSSEDQLKRQLSLCMTLQKQEALEGPFQESGKLLMLLFTKRRGKNKKNRSDKTMINF
ncbi:uncharacterized protein MONOS_101 [Monocercomonoides exilis]|uniref:uncharacterized protein n=1 Tax=Monocercomonoides exilis TaxID=2049356 RepID=UPI00355996DA|nr:hypothetical protein MONOS_101 [Monocercomonoides exilis]|eukprot:MONOS_101.1-p1 / transcript=MONOS_101.1 / gene=MONOS_101 / organism=Monocercomonoides_exilis_PA203 / gene_product=unspecified product / transcript_product=unspecified product / location=Mono_scaffold00002:76548-77075(-) / protein_length=86 / sequence_SO=supercontig / SO=protein_coding / is_pseudo=false